MADQPVANPTSPPPTPTPTPEPTETQEPTVTAWPTLDANVCPLTGLSVSDPALLERRPLAIKVQNAEISRPQFGLPQADIVYEHLSEAGITRFTAIYLCQEVDKIGSTRSARFIDLEIPAMYKSLMAFSGTSAGLYPKFLNADFYDREFCYGWGLHSEAFYRDKELREQGIPIEHTLFADPAKMWEIADELGINERQDLQGMTFSPGTAGRRRAGDPHPHSLSPAATWSWTITTTRRAAPIGAGRLAIPSWTPSPASRSRSPTSSSLYATHVDTDIYEDEPRRNHPSVQIQIWGTGPAVLFRDGQVYEGLWARPQRDHMLVFRDPTGQIPIPLKPGNTWYHTRPPGRTSLDL